MRWDKLCIQADRQVYAVLEVLDGHLWNGDERGAMLHALCVLLRTEDINHLVRGITECFQAFVALLAVVQTGCHAVQAQKGVFYELGRCPFSRFLRVRRFDVAVYFADAEADVVPVLDMS